MRDGVVGQGQSMASFWMGLALVENPKSATCFSVWGVGFGWRTWRVIQVVGGSGDTAKTPFMGK